MMSISPLKSASNASKYYLAEENPNALPDMSLEQQGDNYYLKEQGQGDHTFWYGKLAKEAGLLNQAVDEKTLQTVLSGTLNGETIKGKREHHRAGFDLTFSAPKNASILALVGGDTRLIDAHNNAVKFALSDCQFVFCELECARMSIPDGRSRDAGDFEISSQGILGTSRLRRFGIAAASVVHACQQQERGVAELGRCQSLIR